MSFYCVVDVVNYFIFIPSFFALSIFIFHFSLAFPLLAFHFAAHSMQPTWYDQPK